MQIQGSSSFRAFALASAGIVVLAVAPLRAAPVVGTFAPTSGSPGTQVTINGTGFSAVTLVRFDDVPADFVVVSATTIIAAVPLEATDGPIRVSDAGGEGSSGLNFFLPAPRISSVSPERGATNTTVVIDGANFRGTTSVRFGDVAALFVLTTPDQLRATVPSGATNGPITVATPAGSVSTAEDFVVIGPAPIVDGFSPPWGAPGSTVVVRGVNFGATPQVRFGTTLATAVAPTESTINAVVPNLAASAQTITVTTTGGTFTTATNFTITLAPVITNVAPNIGKPGQTEVVIEGVNWSTLADVSGVGFNGRSVSSLSVPVAGQIRVTVPNGATTGPITVTNNLGGVKRVGSSPSPFFITNAPVIESFDPELGTPGVTSVSITGFNLSNGPTVLRFNITVAPFTMPGQVPERISATVPLGAATGPISLSNRFGVFTTTNVFSVLSEKPLITALTPDHAPRGAQVILEGRNFFNPVSVRFNGILASETFASTPTRMTVTVPANARSGPVRITTPNGTNSNLIVFHAPPRITSIAPVQGGVGDVVTLAGLNFTNTTSIEFGGAPSMFMIVSDTNLTATIPLDALTGFVRLETPGGVVQSGSTFKVLPRITGFDPPLGPNGAAVTLLGTSFRNVSSVTFNSRPAAFTVDSPQQIHTAVPQNATTGKIAVTTADAVATSVSNFVVTTSSDLRLRMTPSATLVAPGTPVSFALQVTNRGGSSVTGVRVVDTLPGGLAYTNATATQGSISYTNGVVTAELGILLTNASAGVTIQTVAIADGLWPNVAVVSSIEPDDGLFDNTASTNITVLSDASATLQIQLLSGTNGVMVFWPATSVPFVLQFAVDLTTNTATPVIDWQPVPETPGTVGEFKRVTNAVSGDRRYYRLRMP